MATVNIGPFQRIVGFHFNSSPWVGYGTFQWGTATGFYDVYSPSHGSSPEVGVFCFVFSKLNFPALWMASGYDTWYSLDYKDETGSWVPVSLWSPYTYPYRSGFFARTFQFYDQYGEHYYMDNVEIAGRTLQPIPPDEFLRDLDVGLILFGFQDPGYFAMPENPERLEGKIIRIILVDR